MTGARDHRRPQRVDLHRLAAAEVHYEAAGYVPVAVPWVVPDRAYRATLPPEATPYATLGGNLVASGEQSFLEMLLDGQQLGMRQCTTPCFRDEVHDELHDPYFMKLELIRTDDTSAAALERMVQDAAAFFARYVTVAVADIGDGSFDLVDARFGIELGSYGRRSRDGLTWLYGTGLAEPRLTRVLERVADARR